MIIRPARTTSWFHFDWRAALIGCLLIGSLTACGGGGGGGGNTPQKFTLGGSISGLTSAGLVLANGSDTLTVSANTTTFTMPTTVSSGTTFSISVQTQPTELTCNVTNGSGTMGSANVSNVAVACIPKIFTLGGSITGLTSNGLVLANGNVTFAPSANATSFTLPGTVTFGSAYNVTVQSQPTGLTCNVTNGSGTMGNANVSNVAVACVVNTWSEQAYLKASNAEAQDNFGTNVAISGDTLVVGAFGESSNQTTITNGGGASSDNSAGESGAVYVFVRNGNAWSQQAYLKASNAEAQDSFGTSVAISGDTIVVGAFGEDSNQTTITNGSAASADNSASRSGAAYIFVRNGTTWSQQAYLKASNAEAGDIFGDIVSISGDTVVVGARREASNQRAITNGSGASNDNSANFSGAAYVFVRNGTTWSQQAYLKASNADTDDEFGDSVSISGDTIVVGAAFESSNQRTITNGTDASPDNSAREAGSAYVFVRSGTTWSQQAYLKASNADAVDRFGFNVAVDGDTVVVSAFFEDSSETTITNGGASADNSAESSGAAYVFVRNDTTWSQQAYLKASNAETDDLFGTSVAISGDTVVVGSFFEDSNQTTITNGSNASPDNSANAAGAAYVFVRNGAAWSQQAYLKAPNAEANDVFGGSVSISGDTVVASALTEDSNQTTVTNGSGASADNSAFDAGAVYVFEFGS